MQKVANNYLLYPLIANTSQASQQPEVQISNKDLFDRGQIDKLHGKITQDPKLKEYTKPLGLSDFIMPKKALNKILFKVLYRPEPILSLLANKRDPNSVFKLLENSTKRVENFFVRTKDKHSIRAFFVGANPEKANGLTKVIVHGNGGDMGSNIERALNAYDLGYNVCIYSYRGYSDNPGIPSEEGLINDTNAVLDNLIYERGISPESLVLDAHSLGCAVTLCTLATRAKQNEIDNKVENFKALDLFAPFTNVRAMAKYRLMLAPSFFVNWFCKDIWNNLKALETIKASKGLSVDQISVFHGSQDRVVPVKFGEELYQYAKALGYGVNLMKSDSHDHGSILSILEGSPEKDLALAT